MKLFPFLPALLALLALAVTPARATTYTWQNLGSDFTAADNWSPDDGPPTSATADLAQFLALDASRVNPVLDSAATTRLWFGSLAPGAGFTLSGTGSVTGGSSSASGIITRGVGATTIDLGDGTEPSLILTGSANSSATPALNIGTGTTLVLSGNTVATVGSSSASAIRGGTLVLDNSAGNPAAQRLTASYGLFFTGGGSTLEFRSASAGSEFTGLTGTLSNQAGSATVRLDQTSATGPLSVTFGSFFVSTQGTFNFVNAGFGTLGGGGADDPSVKFTTTPTSTNGVIGQTNGTLGTALVNGSDYAGYDATNGVYAITSTAVSGALATASTQNSRLTGDATIAASTTIAYNTLKIAPSASGQSLALGSAGALQTTGILLAGATSYAITGGSSARILYGDSSTGGTIFVADPAAVLSVDTSVGPSSGGGATTYISKSGDGFLWLNGTANQVSYTGGSNLLTFALEGGVLRVNSTSFDLTTGNKAPKVAFRGGVLEYDVSGGDFLFARALGTTAGGVAWGSSSAVGSGGFSAWAGTSNSGAGNGNKLTVNIGGSGATLTWASTSNFIGDGLALKFGSILSNATVDFQNPIALDGGTAGSQAIRQIDVTKGVGNAADKTQLTGVISGSGTTALLKTGTGVLELAGTNTYTGVTSVADGTLLVTGSIASSALTTVAAGATLGGGGTVGAVALDGAISPGNSPGTLHTGSETWNPGASYVWEINQADGTAGTSWDLLDIAGTLDLTGLTASSFTLSILSLDPDNAPGNLANFDPAQNYTWVLATASGGISGFSVGKFAIAASDFTNPHSGTFSLSLSEDEKSLTLSYSAVPEPAAWGAAIATLLAVAALLRRRARLA